jgi:hypothetical protein
MGFFYRFFTNRVLTLLTVFFCFAKGMDGKQIDETTASLIGINYMSNKAGSTQMKMNGSVRLAYTAPSNCFYVFNVRSGFVIVAGDDNVYPILGYSTEGSFDSTKIPPQVAGWLNGYRRQIDFVVSHAVKATQQINAEWARLKGGQVNASSERLMSTANAVLPLIQTKWNQLPYYNAFCPYDYQEHGLSVTGCVATTMAQIMKYWNYPRNGTDFHSYSTSYGTLSSNFGASIYRWDSMPATLSGSNAFIASLMYQCGVSVEMQYSTLESSAWVITANDTICAQTAFVKYFQYDSTTIQGLVKQNYTDSAWISLIENELNQGRPVEYVGDDPTAGHSWVCDGYDSTNNFHMNWGWAGQFDGYFSLNALYPYGSLDSAVYFTSGQQVLIGIQPTPQMYDLKLDSYIAAPGEIVLGQAFAVSANIINAGTTAFNGDFCLALFDRTGNFITNIDSLLNLSLPAGQAFNQSIVFPYNPDLARLLPGKYNMYIRFRPSGGNWDEVGNNGGYINPKSITFVSKNNLRIYSDMNYGACPDFITDQRVSVSLNVINLDTGKFNGELNLSLYSEAGGDSINIQQINAGNLFSKSHYGTPVTFSSQDLNAPAGNYLMALKYKNSQGNWALSGADSTFLNPISVTVATNYFPADNYEPNNSATSAYNLPLTGTGDTLNAIDSTANIEFYGQVDYYKIVLPPDSDFDYMVTAHLSQLVNSDNSGVYAYTADVLLKSSSDSIHWSSTNAVNTNNKLSGTANRVLYFSVSPLACSVGTYLLGVSVIKESATGIKNIILNDQLKIYPNPAENNLIVDLADFSGKLSQLSVIDLQGQRVLFVRNTGSDRILQLAVGQLAGGFYFLQLQTDQGIITKKIVIKN